MFQRNKGTIVDIFIRICYR